MFARVTSWAGRRTWTGCRRGARENSTEDEEVLRCERPAAQNFLRVCVVSSALFSVAGSGITAKDTDRLNRIIRKASSVLGVKLDAAEMVEERQRCGEEPLQTHKPTPENTTGTDWACCAVGHSDPTLPQIYTRAHTHAHTHTYIHTHIQLRKKITTAFLCISMSDNHSTAFCFMRD